MKRFLVSLAFVLVSTLIVFFLLRPIEALLGSPGHDVVSSFVTAACMSLLGLLAFRTYPASTATGATMFVVLSAFQAYRDDTFELSKVLADTLFVLPTFAGALLHLAFHRREAAT